MLSATDQSRREFLGFFGSLGLSSTLFPGVLWANVQNAQEPKITRAMLKDAAVVAGLDFTDQELDAMLAGVNQNLGRYDELRKIPLDMNVGLPLAFIPIAPSVQAQAVTKPLALSRRPAPRRPANLESVAFWPVTDPLQGRSFPSVP